MLASIQYVFFGEESTLVLHSECCPNTLRNYFIPEYGLICLFIWLETNPNNNRQ